MFWSLTLGFIGSVSLCLLPALCCRPKEYQTEDGQCCPVCDEGTVVTRHCTVDVGTSCKPCANGTYMNEPNGWRECFRCSICHSGSGLLVLRPCTSSSDSVCGARSGFFCQNFSQEYGGCEVAQKHATCSPGQRLQQPGTSSADTVCEDCPEGHFSPTGLNCTAWTICFESQVEVRAGSSQEDVLCGGAVSRSHFILSIPFVGVLIILIPVLYKLKGQANPKRDQNNAQL
ncbi:tumor necrosis factor receptor superfamily member 14 [Eucyclogobius newberryi]|uniref:tumor necrosis factor receptor superfamily member 14 n=1 Tax=Eucyclogobius newberryi TaxID=166745 RepID=UPI003B593053